MEVNIDKMKVIKYSGNGQCCKTIFLLREKDRKCYKLQIFGISI